ncbi:S1C family serine protease [Chloroflexota bacterium]
MLNRVIIVILVFLMILSGGLGYYSYTLSQQLNDINEQLTVFQQEQASQIAAVHNEITTLRGETLTNFSATQDEIGKTLTRVKVVEGKAGTLENELGETSARVGTLEEETSESLTRIDTLEDELGSVSGELSNSVINASEIYQKASQATVRISNGEQTNGSGFLLDTEGHVITANHVVDDLSNIYVIFPDGKTMKATNIGSSPFSDIAVLKVDGELDIEPPPLADSAMVRIGEPVVTIGNPLGLTETLTSGIISQVNRSAEIDYNSGTRWITNLIQFDAAVNFGNSGCALLNSRGEVLGLVIARVDPDEGDGIYYAVSSNKVKKVTDSLIANGSFEYPWLGVGIADITPNVVQTKSLETANGALVMNIFADSPAAAAGIRVDDIITAIDGITISDTAYLTSYIGEHKSPGDATTLTLIRDTSDLELSLEIGKRTPE